MAKIEESGVAWVYTVSLGHCESEMAETKMVQYGVGCLAWETLLGSRTQRNDEREPVVDKGDDCNLMREEKRLAARVALPNR